MNVIVTTLSDLPVPQRQSRRARVPLPLARRIELTSSFAYFSEFLSGLGGGRRPCVALFFRLSNPWTVFKIHPAGNADRKHLIANVVFTMMKACYTWQISLLGMACLCLISGCASDPMGRGNPTSESITVPSPEMVDVTHGPGVPFGGIGTGFSVFGKYGFVDVYFDGRHLNGGDWHIDRPPKEKPAFAFELTEGDKSLVL